MISFTRHLAAAAACAALALPVLAQPGPAAPAAGDAPASQMQQRNGPGADRQARRAQWQEKRAERRAQHLAALKSKLAITPAQEGAWTQFVQAMQPRSDFARLDRSTMQSLSTPERIDRMRAQRAQRDAAMDARGDAIKAFYAQLQPEQQKTFDSQHAGMAGERMHRGQGRHGHGRMGPRGD
jgi:hypothetical protein